MKINQLPDPTTTPQDTTIQDDNMAGYSWGSANKGKKKKKKKKSTSGSMK